MKKNLLCLSILMVILLWLTPSPFQAQNTDPVGFVTGIVYRDGFLDREPYTPSNGQQDLTETPFQGVQLRVEDPAGNRSETVTTGEDGKYSIPIYESTFLNGMSDLSVKVLNPDGFHNHGISQKYVQSTDGIVGNDVIQENGQFVPISTPFNLTSPGTAVRNFGFRSPILTVTGKIYNDTNGNSEFNESETGVAGRTVTIKDTTGKSIKNTNGEELSIVTGEDGAFTFQFTVEEGSFHIFFTSLENEYLSSSKESTELLIGSDFKKDYNAQLTAYTEPKFIGHNRQVLYVNGAIAGIATPDPNAGKVTGVFYDDKNHNGLQDEGEPGLPNLKLQVAVLDSSEVATWVSDGSGQPINFFTGMDGSYWIEIPATMMTAYPTNQWLVKTDLACARNTPQASADGKPGNDFRCNLPESGSQTTFAFDSSKTAVKNAAIPSWDFQGVVYADFNDRSTKQADEYGLSGINIYFQTNAGSFDEPNMVRLKDINGTEINLTTDENGQYFYHAISHTNGGALGTIGEHIELFTPWETVLNPAGTNIEKLSPFYFTRPGEIGSDFGEAETSPFHSSQFTPQVGQAHPKVSEKNAGVPFFRVSGIFFNDANKNSVRDAGEAGVAEIKLMPKGMQAYGGTAYIGNMEPVYTDSEGRYAIDYLEGINVNTDPTVCSALNGTTYTLSNYSASSADPLAVGTDFKKLEDDSLEKTFCPTYDDPPVGDLNFFGGVINSVPAADADKVMIRNAGLQSNTRTITGVIYGNKGDDNWDWQPGELGIPNIKLEIVIKSSETVVPASEFSVYQDTTDANGRYKFVFKDTYNTTGVNFVVRAVFPEGTTGHQFGPDTPSMCTSTASQVCNDFYRDPTSYDNETHIFQIEEPVTYKNGAMPRAVHTIAGLIYNDYDGDSEYQTNPGGNDDPVAGRAVYLNDAAGNPILNPDATRYHVITDSKGKYTLAFTDAAASKQWVVTMDSPAGELIGKSNPISNGDRFGNEFSKANASDTFASVAITSQSGQAVYAAGAILAPSIRGIVYHDINANSILDEGDSAVSYYSVSLCKPDGTVVASDNTTTPSLGGGDFIGGKYTFKGSDQLNLEDGPYVVCVPQRMYELFSPKNPSTDTVIGADLNHDTVFKTVGEVIWRGSDAINITAENPQKQINIGMTEVHSGVYKLKKNWENVPAGAVPAVAIKIEVCSAITIIEPDPDNCNHEDHFRPFRLIQMPTSAPYEKIVTGLDSSTPVSYDLTAVNTYRFTEVMPDGSPLNLPNYTSVRNPDSTEGETPNQINVISFTNTYTPPEKITVTGTKTWSAGTPNAVKNTAVVKFKLQRRLAGSTGAFEDFTDGATKTLDTANGATTVTWEVDKTDANNTNYEFQIIESSVPTNFTMSRVDALTILNTYVDPKTTTMLATKRWMCGAVPSGWTGSWPTTTFTLYRHYEGDALDTRVPVPGQPTKTFSNGCMTGNSTGNQMWSGLAQYDDTNGKKWIYSAVETPIQGYQMRRDGTSLLTVTNIYDGIESHDPDVPGGYLTVSVTKKWEGLPAGTAQVGAVTIGLKRNDVLVPTSSRTIPAGAPDAKTIEWSGLHRFAPDGTPYTYAVVETSLPNGFTKAISGSVADGFTITNTYDGLTDNTTDPDSPDTKDPISVAVTKLWNAPAEAPKPDVTVQLYQNGAAMDGKTMSLTAASPTKSWTGLLIYNAEGNNHVYTVDELEAPANYVKESITGSVADGFTITNAYDLNQLTTTFVATKVWANLPTGEAGANVTLQLMQDGVDFQEPKAVNWVEAGNVTVTWTGLPKYKNASTEYVYTVKETSVPNGYAKTQDGNTITNTYDGLTDNTNPDNPVKKDPITVVGLKNWAGLSDANAPKPTISFQLTRNTIAYLPAETVDPATNEAKWEGLTVYAPDGTAYAYAVSEPSVPNGYQASGPIQTEENKWKITNTYNGVTDNHTDPDNPTDKPKITVSAAKIWANIPEGSTAPASARVKLVVDSVVTGEEKSFPATWSDLFVYGTAGNPIVYSVKETSLPNGYVRGEPQASTEPHQFTITNTYDGLTDNTTDPNSPVKKDPITIQTRKIWIGLPEGETPPANGAKASLMVNGVINADSEKTLTTDVATSAKWENLVVFAPDGAEIAYFVKETSLTNGYRKVSAEQLEGIHIFTNEYDGLTDGNGGNNQNPPVSVTVTKRWVNVPAGQNPSAKLVIYQNTDPLNEVTLTYDGSNAEMQHTWNFLKKYAPDGSVIAYPVDEPTAPEGYRAEQNGYIFTNTYEGGNPPDDTQDVTAHVVWNGGNGPRPTIWLQLFRSDEGATSKVLETIPEVKKLTDGMVSATWENMAVKSSGGDTYTYFVYQVLVDEATGTITNSNYAPPGYLSTRSSDGLTITNQYVGGELPGTGFPTKP